MAGCVIFVRGDLLASQEKYLCHQTNCVTSSGKAKGVAQAIFQHYPYANIYHDEISRIPGEILIRGDGHHQRYVINMCCQRYPGKPRYSNDTTELRKFWFLNALEEISKIDDLESVAFPYGIGCGYGGGVWSEYAVLLEEFAEKVNARVIVYQLDPP
jgi:hypothetical protein